MIEGPSQEKGCTVADFAQEVNIRWSAVEQLDTELAASWRQVTIDERSRYRLWSNNLGACHPVEDQRSADHRLRAAPDVQRRIAQLLEELCEGLDDIQEIQSGERQGGVEEEELDTTASSDNDEGTRPRSEISELWLLVGDVITSLLKVSALVRQSSSRNKFDHAVKAAAKATSSSMPMTWDVDHIRQKFPKLEAKQWLIQRLGETATQRRTFLMYAEEHERRIASGRAGNDGKKSVTSRPTEPSTRATTFVPADFNSSLLHQLEDYDGDDAVSTTSATTGNTAGGYDGGANTLSVVPLSSVCVDSKPAICPYCRGMVHFKREKAWRRHVFSDLMAYSCTLEHCDHGPFGSRTAWANHEKRHHLRSWSCPVCHSEFDTQARVARHVAAEHPMIDRTLSSELIHHESPQIERVAISQCPFCDGRRLWTSALGPTGSIALKDQSQVEQNLRNTLVPVSLYHRHMSRHMEQLALFAVPSSTGDADNEAGASDRDAQIASSLGDTIHSFEEIHESADERDVATDTAEQPTPAGPSEFVGVDAEVRPQYPDFGMPNDSDHPLNFRSDNFELQSVYSTQDQHLRQQKQPQHSAIDADEAEGDIGNGGQGAETRFEPTTNTKSNDDRVTSSSDRPSPSPASDGNGSGPSEADSIPTNSQPEAYTEANCSATTNVHDFPLSEEIRILEREGTTTGKAKDKMWTEVTKDLVIKEAIEEYGYEYEETEEFFYILEYLRYEDVSRLVDLTEDIRHERRERIREIQWEREELERLPKLPPQPPVPTYRSSTKR